MTNYIHETLRPHQESTFNVLSPFDGMSCLQIALNRLGMRYDNYYASEIDKYAIQVTQHNYPDTIQLGDITKWQEWDLPKIDLITGGSPCQGFSYAGKGLNFDDPRSKLFFVFEDIVKHYKPRYWLLENVVMRQEWQDVISQRLGIKPIMINSALVSAQNRKRLYWTNWNFGQPEDRGLVLADIVENGFADRQKSFCLDANYYKGGNLKRYFEKNGRQLVFKKNYAQIINNQGNQSQSMRIYYLASKSPTIVSHVGGFKQKIFIGRSDFRNLTPLECERLQTVPDNYTLVLDKNGKQKVSNTQRYKMLGNGWTVDAICHILSHMDKHNV